MLNCIMLCLSTLHGVPQLKVSECQKRGFAMRPHPMPRAPCHGWVPPYAPHHAQALCTRINT